MLSLEVFKTTWIGISFFVKQNSLSVLKTFWLYYWRLYYPSLLCFLESCLWFFGNKCYRPQLFHQLNQNVIKNKNRMYFSFRNSNFHISCNLQTIPMNLHQVDFFLLTLYFWFWFKHYISAGRITKLFTEIWTEKLIKNSLQGNAQISAQNVLLV